MDLHTEIEIDAPADAAWEVLGTQFGGIGTWATAIVASSLDRPVGVGAVRTCEIQGFGPVAAGALHERLLTYDPEQRALSYEVVKGLPPMMTRAVNRWQVHAIDAHRCRVTSHATVTLVWWMRPVQAWVRRRLRKDTGSFQDELRHRVLHGTPHPRKASSAALAS